jgi:hypothetical protein
LIGVDEAAVDECDDEDVNATDDGGGVWAEVGPCGCSSDDEVCPLLLIDG